MTGCGCAYERRTRMGKGISNYLDGRSGQAEDWKAQMGSRRKRNGSEYDCKNLWRMHRHEIIHKKNERQNCEQDETRRGKRTGKFWAKRRTESKEKDWLTGTRKGCVGTKDDAPKIQGWFRTW